MIAQNPDIRHDRARAEHDRISGGQHGRKPCSKSRFCGITTVVDALATAAAGADAVGLNFFSRQQALCCNRARRRDCRCPSAGGIVKVGVFVNATEQEIRHISKRVRLDAIQLHGDESPEFMARHGRPALVRAFRLDASGLQPIDRYLAACRELRVVPRMILVDACVPASTGERGLRWTGRRLQRATPGRARYPSR